MRGDDLKTQLAETRATQRELADYMQVDPRVVHRIITGRRKNISNAEADAIKRFFESRRELALSVTRPKAVLSASINLGPRPPVTEIPLYGAIETEEGWRVSLAPGSKIGIVPPHPNQVNAIRPFAVKVAEGNMTPRLEVGEIAYVVSGRSLARGHDCLIEYPDQTARIFQFVDAMDRALVVSQFHPRAEITIPGVGTLAHTIVGIGMR